MSVGSVTPFIVSTRRVWVPLGWHFRLAMFNPAGSGVRMHLQHCEAMNPFAFWTWLHVIPNPLTGLPGGADQYALHRAIGSKGQSDIFFRWDISPEPLVGAEMVRSYPLPPGTVTDVLGGPSKETIVPPGNVLGLCLDYYEVQEVQGILGASLDYALLQHVAQRVGSWRTQAANPALPTPAVSSATTPTILPSTSPPTPMPVPTPAPRSDVTSTTSMTTTRAPTTTPQPVPPTAWAQGSMVLRFDEQGI